MAQRKKMWVVSVDKKGHELPDGEWVEVPAPDSFRKNGFAHIESYVVKLLCSTASFASLVVTTPNEQQALGLWNRNGIVYFNVDIDWRAKPEIERAVRDFFGSREIVATEDYLAGNGDTSDALKCLHFCLRPDASEVATLIKEFLREVYGLHEETGLDFYFDG
jgi:hypothetical protein